MVADAYDKSWIGLRRFARFRQIIYDQVMSA